MTDIAKINELKRKLRSFKKLEIKIRFDNDQFSKPLVWDRFFDLQETKNRQAKYSLSNLLSLGREEFKAVINEFLSYVYYELFKESGLQPMYGLYDPKLLEKLNLPYDVKLSDIKKRFRELANRYHPDKGGDAKKFIELMDDYRKLIGNRSES